jgi:hypothetical protein
MSRLGSVPSRCLLLLAAIFSSACGSNRELQSVNISPSVADAKNFANGQVQFVASGTFSKAPSPATLTSQNVAWCIGSTNGDCDPAAPTYPSVDQDGMAQCGPFVGTATVLAGTGSSGVSDAAVFKIFGSAQLTCP